MTKSPARALVPVVVHTGELLAGHVTMSRALNNAAHGLTLNEKRLMMAALRCIDSKRSPYSYTGDGYVKVRVTAEEFAAVANLEKRGGNRQAVAAYEGLREACDHLFQRVLCWTEGTGRRQRQIRLRWVFKATYHQDEAWAEICFSPDLTPHIFMLREKFVRYRLEMARGLRSVYSWRLLELLMQWQDTGVYRESLDTFREKLEIPDTYRYADIKRKVIEMAVEELNLKADLVIQWTAHKKGRSVASLEFRFARNTQLSPEL